MNSSKFRLTLDLHSIQSQYAIPVLVGDTNVTLLMSLTDGGVPYIIEDGCLAKLSVKRPTGTHLEEFCAIRNNAVVEYPFRQNENTCAVEGVHECDLTIYGLDGEKISSPRFTMIVSPKVLRSDDIVLTDKDYTAVDAMVSAEAKRQVAETGRVTAESERVTAEAARADAEAGREETLNSILANEQSRIEAENTRVNNEAERLRVGAIAQESANRAENAVSRVEEIVRTYIGDVDGLIGGDT